jgi:hypothetical protein
VVSWPVRATLHAETYTLDQLCDQFTDTIKGVLTFTHPWNYMRTAVRVLAWPIIIGMLFHVTMAGPVVCNSQDGSASGLEHCNCPEDSYGPEHDGVAYVCTKCPTNLTSVSGSPNIKSCGCVGGMYFEADSRHVADDFWDGVRVGRITGACKHCPSGSTTMVGGIGIYSCMCTSKTSVLVDGGCVEACHLTRDGCLCHLSVHGELVGCGGSSQIQPFPLSGGDLPRASSGGDLGEPPLFSILEFGAVHACAVLYPSGRVLCWNTVPPSSGPRLQTAVPGFITAVRALSLGVEHSCALWGARDTVTCWGMPGVIGQTAVVNVSHNIRMLAVGHPTARHVCFLYVSKMFVSCVGLNTHGQLGLGVGGEHIHQLHAEDIVSYI